ncbi:flagellar biosynthetic protein FliR [Pelotomaculum sp. PtaB.Bin117]|uniref:flagellar biosynthetic protein FliR n=1 Tax=Pelotomaculum sp. PtaB.Bin117 TaxID=1811694 RepID=UPI00257D81EF|nr:flagellar biosynthetic protein FliR [Pelotomaculum sp. PtaB.Bin117]
MPDINQLLAFFLVFLRVAAFMISGPLFGFRGIPPLFKVGFPLALAVVLFPTATTNLATLPGGAWGYGLAAISESGVGLLLGMTVTIILNSIRMAGQMIDIQIGYSMANLVDPMNGVQNTLLAQYMYLLALMLFLIMDGHYTLIMGLAKSYQLVPLSAAALNGSVPSVLIKTFSGAFTIALQVSAPVLAVLLISDLALGFLSRTTPQINVFLTGFLVKIVVGLLTLSFLIPLLGTVFHSLINMIERDLYSLMKVLI